MTAEQMQYSFELKLGVFHDVIKPFTSTDIAMFLNKAQEQIVKSIYSDEDPPVKNFFEKNEKIRTELAALIENISYTAGQMDDSDSALHENAVFVTMPADYLYSLQEMAEINYIDCNNETATYNARVLPIRHDEYTASIKDPFKKPHEKLIWRMDYKNGTVKRHELIHKENDEISTYTLRYLRKPSDINILSGIDCELHESKHEDIVDMAVIMARSTILLKQNDVKQTKEP